MTHADFRLMTPDHASPEQVRGQAITTSSDVYVLGVLLYKLLTGVSPFVIPSMRLTDIERAICEKDPPLPSHAVGTDDSAETRSITEARGVSANRLRRILRGDLDNIVIMAMHKEPERRYCVLAADGQRHSALSGRQTHHCAARYSGVSQREIRQASLVAGVRRPWRGPSDRGIRRDHVLCSRRESPRNAIESPNNATRPSASGLAQKRYQVSW